MPNASVLRRTWHAVTRRARCAVCGKPDWCRVSPDGAMALCRRVAEGGLHRVDTAGVHYWLHVLAADLRSGDSLDAPPFPRTPARAAADILNAVYGAWLALLPLIPRHRADLRRRGLADQDIVLRQYRSLPGLGRAALARRLVERFGPAVCGRIPGLTLHARDGRTWWSLAGAAGLLVPMRDRAGRIVALLVRRDDPDAHPRYVFVSSRSYGGPGCGAPTHVPLREGLDLRPVRLTEGPLKADVATALSGVLTLGLPGVSAWRQALPLLARLRPHRVLLAFDADAARKVAVARPLWQVAKALRQAGFAVALEHWAEALGKGIDDVLARGHRPEILEGAAMWEALHAILRHAHQVDPSLEPQRLLARTRRAIHRLRLPAFDPWLGPRAEWHGIPPAVSVVREDGRHGEG
jgi:uncharacterized protein DUF3854